MDGKTGRTFLIEAKGRFARVSLEKAWEWKGECGENAWERVRGGRLLMWRIVASSAVTTPGVHRYTVSGSGGAYGLQTWDAGCVGSHDATSAQDSSEERRARH